MDENVQAFLRVLDPDDNQTGGGTASAVAGAMAAALVGMVARLSIGKKGLPEQEGFYQRIDQEARRLSGQLLEGGRVDSEAFAAVLGAYRLPKSSPEETDARRTAIQKALIEATRVPLTNAEGCARTLELCRQLRGRENPNAASDLECAWHLTRAGMLGCLSNARLNLASIRDPGIAAELEVRLQTLTAMADEGG